MFKFKFKSLLELNIQMFAGTGDDFDIEAADQAIVQDEEVVEEVDEDLESTDVDEVVDESLEPTDEPDLTNDDGRNTAFANLRRERDQYERDAAFIRDFAEANGMTVEQLKEQYEENRLTKEAEEKGVSVEVMKRLSTLEQENQQVKAQAQSVQFNAQVDSTLAKYSGTQEDFNATIKYAQDNGLVDALKGGAISFEAAYKLANLDSMIESAKKDAVQSDLATRKKRQQEAPVALGSQLQADVGNDLDDLIDADVKEILENGNF